VVDMGPHEALLTRCGVYRQLWMQQNRHLDKRGPRPAAVLPKLTIEPSQRS